VLRPGGSLPEDFHLIEVQLLAKVELLAEAVDLGLLRSSL
jgi:hypothetical protein